ncbi:hypothetical protein KAI32_02610 [Candidatus Pacearchaeota archaeon]|nr:hypothetical protein [Candidatus Pacearchaeota archaeon]
MGECGLLNLASCIPEKLCEFFISLLNAPLKPLLDFIKSLLTEPVNIEVLAPIWAIILYVLSIFYGLLLLYAGMNFMFSGHNEIKRAKSKEWFQNVFLMILFTQMSFFLYSLILDVSSLLTAGMMNLVNPDFFLLTADNIINIGLQFFFALFYVLILLLTVLILVIRYLTVAIGVVLFPIGIFLYFIPPVQDYGKLILNYLGVCIFIGFFDSVIFLVASQLIEIQIFENMKIMVMMGTFSMVNLLMLYLLFFSIIKSALKTTSSVANPIISVAKYFV